MKHHRRYAARVGGPATSQPTAKGSAMTTPEPGQERFLLRTTGGPEPGTRIIDQQTTGYTWPLPDVIVTTGGEYHKTTESQLPPQPRDSHVLRGVTYDWHPHTEEQ